MFAAYSWLLVVSASNWLLMRRPTGNAKPNFEVLIPARNEAALIGPLVESLCQQGVTVTVCDDDSTDQTATIAAAAGAVVISPPEALPADWTGKNWACHCLAQAATADWVVFLDADTYPSNDFVSRLSSQLDRTPSKVGAVTGLPKMRPGRGIEPAYLAWVPWVLLATNPFGLVTRTRVGHNFFTNGQFTAFRRAVLSEIKPFQTVRSAVLEDVKIGRLFASRRIDVDVLAMANLLEVKMYDDLGSAWRGMLKNSREIGGSTAGSIIFALLLFFLAWGWILAVPYNAFALGALLFSMFFTCLTVRTPWWVIPFAPLTITAAAVTVLTSVVLGRRGKLEWKGRHYGNR